MTNLPLLPLVFVLIFLHGTIFAPFSVKSEVGMMILVCVVVVYFLKSVWVNQWRIRRKLRAQGINGPTPSLFHGNTSEMNKIQASAAMRNTAKDGDEFVAHDYTSTVFPYFEQWRKQYGPVYTYSTGNQQHLYINDPELVKEMHHCISSDLGKPSHLTKKLAPLLGNGIVRANGHFWAQQRKIAEPEFFKDKVKGMVGLMVESALSLSGKWEACLESEGGKVAGIKVDDDLRSFSADVIAKACFGSSYLKGKDIFSKLRRLQKAVSSQRLHFGSHAFGLSSKHQKNKVKILAEEIDKLIWEVVERREKEGNEDKDLLQLILQGAINNNVDKDSSKRFIIDNCKTIYFTGYETTAITVSWCLMLLALYPSWQTRIRSEMAQVCWSTADLNADSLPRLKTVLMVVQETLRLYPPAAFVSRETLNETRIGHLVVPKGVCLWSLIPTLHRDPDIWGLDANEFNPERFENGISKACKLPQVYIPFGLGPRLCLGRNLALVELKIVIAIIVSKFTLALSPNYTHSPAYKMLVEPEHGVYLLIQRCGS